MVRDALRRSAAWNIRRNLLGVWGPGLGDARVSHTRNPLGYLVQLKQNPSLALLMFSPNSSAKLTSSLAYMKPLHTGITEFLD